MVMKIMHYLCIICLAAGLAWTSAGAQTQAASPWLEIGGRTFAGWSGLQPQRIGIANWNVDHEAVFQYPQGPKGWYFFGFQQQNDSTSDWRGYYGFQFKVMVPRGRTLELEATISTPPEKPLQEYIRASRAACSLTGNGQWQEITLPYTDFDYDKARSAFLEFIQQVELTGKFTDGKSGEVKLKDVRLVRAPTIALDAAVTGKAVADGGTAGYEVTVGNCTDGPRDVLLHFERYGWETMTAFVEPSRLTLAPGATATCQVTVQLPEGRIPPGGHETQTLLATANGNGSACAKLDLITARNVARPGILLTPRGWDAVRQKAERYDWAKSQAREDIAAAEDWQVPEAATPEQRARDPQGHPYVFWVTQFANLSRAATAWQLTRNTNYAGKSRCSCGGWPMKKPVTLPPMPPSAKASRRREKTGRL